MTFGRERENADEQISALWKYLKGCGEETQTLSFERISKILGFPIDHSFLNYKLRKRRAAMPSEKSP